MIVFDDSSVSSFYPLALTRSVGDLRCGILKLRQRLQALFGGEEDSLWIEDRLADLYRERHPEWQVNRGPEGGELCVNSRLMVTDEAIRLVQGLKPGQALVNSDILLAFRPTQNLPGIPTTPAEAGCEAVPCDLDCYINLSDLIHDNDRLLRYDFDRFFGDKDNYFETEPGVTALNPYQIWIAEGVELKPGVVLDASYGPIILDEGVKILPNAVLTGPVYIGKNSLIKVGAKLYGPSSIGAVCKVGGEVEGSIFQAYSNKQHDGFLGHSYVGEWVNIGADTNNSDLKNTYKNVSLYSYPTRGKIDSETMFLGALIGDHVKLGINTSINTGCVIGVGSNLWGSALISDFIPDFSWGMAGSLEIYRFEAFCQTAVLVKNRRKLAFTSAEEAIYKRLWSELGRGE